MVVAALAVLVGLNEPQVLAGVQLQVTPAFAGSLATVAAIVAVAPGARDEGGGVLSVTVTATLTVMLEVLALMLVLVTEVAVIITLPAAEGAV